MSVLKVIVILIATYRELNEKIIGEVINLLAALRGEKQL